MYPFFAFKPLLLLYPFRYYDDVRERWIRARYVAERHEIAARYEQWEITGPPEIRSRDAPMFSTPAPRPAAHRPPAEDDPPPDHGPTPDPAPVEQPPPLEDQVERFLALLFLRRYVTWCARTRRFAAMEGAAKLHRRLSPFAERARRPLSAKSGRRRMW